MKFQCQITLWIVGLSFLLSLIGCKQKTVYPNTLLRIDSLIVHHPDSALYMLDLLDDFMTTQPEKIQIYHCLLKTKAREECHKPHFSDLLMKRVVNFYCKNGPSDKLAEAYFLLACIYRDLKEIPYALEYYQKAIDVRTSFTCHSLKSCSYAQIGALFTSQGMHFEATDVYRKACFHARLVCDSLEIAHHYKNLARNFVMRNKMDSTMKYYDLAFQYDSTGTVHERINLYIRQKEFEKARKFLDENDNSYSEWGDYYHGINKRDSASIYYQYALDNGIIDGMQKLNIYRRLALYAEEQGRIIQALMYTKIVNGLLDSLNVNRYTEVEERMRALYSFHDIASEMDNQIYVEGKNERDWVLWMTGVVLLVGFVVWLLYYNRKKCFFSSSSKKKLSELLDLPTCRLVKINARNPDFKLNDAQWGDLKLEIDIVFNGFTDRLLSICPKLNDVDLRVCYLLKLGLSPTDIAHIIVRQTNTVSSIRERLYKKIHGVEGSSKQFDQFLKEF